MLVFMVLMIVLVLILLGVYNDVDVGLMLIMYEVTVCSYWRNDVRSTKYVTYYFPSRIYHFFNN